MPVFPVTLFLVTLFLVSCPPPLCCFLPPFAACAVQLQLQLQATSSSSWFQPLSVCAKGREGSFVCRGVQCVVRLPVLVSRLKILNDRTCTSVGHGFGLLGSLKRRTLVSLYSLHATSEQCEKKRGRASVSKHTSSASVAHNIVPCVSRQPFISQS